ncbi:MFS transporter [Humibacter ginsenosidimutans]|uniref:MFS transporter n=1 Tax=Humibacter ginsenosidimutans TaxID=2599293 RepID=A0A5B8M4D0_9MICO|nr:MFS transporter [Humibacter ginsenosidimutans]QDZ14645.1 MFS transporter [Humibacter ginsenosidimutans]
MTSGIPILRPALTAARIPHRAGFWVIALAFLTEMAFCAVPTPLYAIYQRQDGFPTVILTVVFASYAVGVMLSLYLAGHISDWIGRRRIILASLLVNLLAAVLFLVWNDVAGLIVARFISGLGIGILAAAATAHLGELGAASDRSSGHSSIVATFANLGGIGLGPLIGGLIAIWTTSPLVIPYVLFAALFAAEGVLVAFVPETVEPRRDRVRYRPQRIAAPQTRRGAYWAAAIAAFAAFAVFGTFMGLSSTFLVGILAQHSPLLAGISPFIVFMAAATAQIVTSAIPITHQIRLAITLAVVGLACVGLGAALASLALFLIGGGVTGAGIGILFRGAMSTAAAVADAQHRGEAVAGIFLIAYAGMTVPPLLTAVALGIWPAVAVLVGVTLVAAVLVMVSGVTMLRNRS